MLRAPVQPVPLRPKKATSSGNLFNPMYGHSLSKMVTPGRRPRWDTFDATHQPVEGHPPRQVNAGTGPKLCFIESLATRSLWRVRRQAESQEALGAYAPLHLPPLEDQAHLFVVPRTQAVRAKKSDARIALVKRLFNRRLPTSARDQVPFVQAAGYRPRSSSLAARSLTAGLSAPL
jgi:hypothetical protein